jgi:Phospholipase B
MAIMTMVRRFCSVAACVVLTAGCASRPAPPPRATLPDAVELAKTASRYEVREGWHIVHLKGSPEQIGRTHGLVLAPRIDEMIKATKADMEHSLPREHGWEFFRGVAERVSWPRVPATLQAEIKAIAAGVKEAGFDYDWKDILLLNASIELPSYWYPVYMKKVTGVDVPSRAPEACSAFVATGSMTRDGGVVMGQNFWWSYLTGQHFNVVFCIEPDEGHPFVMDGAPGFVHSGTDMAVSGAGLMLCETTISGFVGYDEKGVPEFVRMRQAIQMASSIDEMVSLFRAGNNGGYANAWLMGDAKTGEIARLELGLINMPLSRSKDGSFVGANFAVDPGVKSECPGVDFTKWLRRDRWEQLMTEHKGRIDDVAASAFLADTVNAKTGKVGASANTLCGRADLDRSRGYSPGGAVSNRVVTSGMLSDPQRPVMLAKWGFADGSSFSADDYLGGRGKQHRWMQGLLHDIEPGNWISVGR